MKQYQIEFRIEHDPAPEHIELSKIVGRNTIVMVDFTPTEVEFLPAEPNAGFPCDFYEVTDVDLIKVSIDNETENGLEFDISKFSQGIVDYLKSRCLSEALDHPDWGQALADADADRRYEAMMEERWERESDNF